MKAKVIIENVETEILLIPENDFDERVVQTVATKGDRFECTTYFKEENIHRQHIKKPHIVIKIEETK